jgi:hypothetical protein
MQPVFEPIDLLRQDGYRRRLAACPQVSSDYSFINLWGWADAYGLEWSWEESLVWIRQTRPEPLMWAPVGDWHAVDWPRRLADSESGMRLTRVPAALAEHWEAVSGRRVERREARGHWDYLYDAEALIGLSGNRYHKKKNLVNQFQRTYPYTYAKLSPDLVNEALGLQADWCTWRDCEAIDMLSAENQVITRILNHWTSLAGVCGGTLRVGDRMAAYTVGERLTPDTMLIHFEKANPEFKGGYQMINQAFLSANAEGLKWVNREQDLDDEGLRQAKLSYHPADFIRKYEVVFLPAGQ